MANEHRELITEDRKIDKVMCKVSGLGSFQCFSRNSKPRIWFKYYKTLKRGWWCVTRDQSIRWKHLTMQEKENLHAAYEYVRILNHKYEERLYADKV